MRLQSFARCFLCVVLAVCLSGAAPLAATYYVATTGSDANSCGTATSSGTPKASISNAAGCLSAGDTLLVRGGTYDDKLVNTALAGASWSNKVRIAAYPGETVWMRPSSGEYVVYLAGQQRYLEFDGINYDGANMMFGTFKIEEDAPSVGSGNAHHIRVQNAEVLGTTSAHGIIMILDAGTVDVSVGSNELLNLRIHRTVGDDFVHGIYVKSSYNLISGCDISDFPGGGIHLFNSHALIYANQLRGNTIHDGQTTAAGQRHWGIILADGSTDTQVVNNVVYGMPAQSGDASAFLLLYSGSGNLLYNDTAYGNAGLGFNIGNGDATPISTQIKNSIAYANAAGDFVNAGRSTVATNNLFGTNPLFVNAATHDFRLQAGSPARNTGTSIALVTTDITGSARPKEGTYDMGAYEYGAGAAPPSAPTGLHVVPD